MSLNRYENGGQEHYLSEIPQHISLAAAEFPNGLDTYKLTVYDESFHRIKEKRTHDHVRNGINGSWMLLTNSLGIEPEPMDIRDVTIWPNYRYDKNGKFKFAIRKLQHNAPFVPRSGGAYAPLTRSVHVANLTDNEDGYSILMHELGHSILSKRFNITIRDFFLHEGFAELATTFLKSAKSGSDRPREGIDLTTYEFDWYRHIINDPSNRKHLPYQHTNGWFFRYLFENYGLEKLVSLHNPKKFIQTNTRARLEMAYDTDGDTLFYHARRWLFPNEGLSDQLM